MGPQRQLLWQIKVMEMRLIKNSSSLSVTAILSLLPTPLLNPSCPSPAKSPRSHYPPPSISLLPSNSASLCSRAIRCCSPPSRGEVWEKRGFSPLSVLFPFLQYCRPESAVTHSEMYSMLEGISCMCVSACMCSMFPGIAV